MKSADGRRLFAILKVSWKTSLASCSAKMASVSVCDQLTLTLELLCQSTGIWRSKA